MPENYDDFDRDRDDDDDFADRGGRGVIERAKNSVKAPAIGLIVTGIIGLIFGGLFLVELTSFEESWNEVVKKALSDPTLKDDKKKEMEDRLAESKQPVKMLITGIGTLGLLAGLLAVVGGVQMMSLKGKGFIYSGAILSMIPCTSGCCIMGLPFGIWAIIALGRPEVKAGFAAVARGDG